MTQASLELEREDAVRRKERAAAERSKLPHPEPPPPEELERLKAAWHPPSGWRFLSEINNNYIGLWYIGTGFLFFLLAGVLALLMRAQLAVPNNDFLSQETYNQVFTMHGSIMMFLFAVPIVEALAVLLLPNMVGARDLPFPRLGAYAFWVYAVGGIIFFCSLFFGLAPDGGWFMYPPLTTTQFSPGVNADFWLLGIGFIEIAAIAGAVEIIVGVLRTRAPGMSLDKMPIFAWAMLVFAFMVVFAFPVLMAGTALLEIERSFDWPFFIAERGGDPLLWQHLFWFFGHPEVYVIFLPAAGAVSMILPTMAQTPLAGYRLVILALVATGFLSFGLWVHHMFPTGIPQLSLGFFSAASMAVAIPSGIQVFAWIATIAGGRLRLHVPALFLLGFLFVFTLGGLTGVMVAAVPFDLQVHDTYFVVAHLHYVLIGGMVFPLFAAFYYWLPTASRHPLSERAGRWVFGLLFAGINVAFFPMHITGLLGMPRRVFTYHDYLGWDWLNLLSTVGAFVFAAGVLVFLVDMFRHFRPQIEGTRSGNVWNAPTLEWLPSGTFAARSIPRIESRYPLWDQPNLAEHVEAGHYYLPRTITGGRETLITSPLDAHPQYVMQLPGPSWAPLIAAVATALGFLMLVFKLVEPALAFFAVVLVTLIWWLWDTDYGHTHPPSDIGGGIRLPVYMNGQLSASWWAMLVLLAVAATFFGALVVSYYYLWTVSPQVWPSHTGQRIADPAWPLAAAGLLAVSALAVAFAARALRRARDRAGLPFQLALVIAMLSLAASFGIELYAHLQTGLEPSGTAYGAAVYALVAQQGFLVLVIAVMAIYTIVRSLAGMLAPNRRVTFDNTMLLWYFTIAQGLIALLVVHGSVRLLD